jgi:hypothetical protein
MASGSRFIRGRAAEWKSFVQTANKLGSSIAAAMLVYSQPGERLGPPTAGATLEAKALTAI